MQKRKAQQRVNDSGNEEKSPNNNGWDDNDHNYIIQSGEILSGRFRVDSFIGKIANFNQNIA